MWGGIWFPVLCVDVRFGLCLKAPLLLLLLLFSFLFPVRFVARFPKPVLHLPPSLSSLFSLSRSLPRRAEIVKTFANNDAVVFGDVVLSGGGPRGGATSSPGAGGWPTIRYYNKETGVDGANYEKKTDMSMCTSLSLSFLLSLSHCPIFCRARVLSL